MDSNSRIAVEALARSAEKLVEALHKIPAPLPSASLEDNAVINYMKSINSGFDTVSKGFVTIQDIVKQNSLPDLNDVLDLNISGESGGKGLLVKGVPTTHAKPKQLALKPGIESEPQQNSKPSPPGKKKRIPTPMAIPLSGPSQPLPVNLNQSTSTSATASISSLDFNSQQTSSKTTDSDIITIPDLNLLTKDKNSRGQSQGQPEIPSTSSKSACSVTLAPEYYNSSSSCNNSDLNLNGYLNAATENMTPGTSKSQLPAPPASQSSTQVLKLSDINLGRNQVKTVVSSPPAPPPGEYVSETIPLPPGDVDLGVNDQEKENDSGLGGEQKLQGSSAEANMNILEDQSSVADANMHQAIAIADEMGMQDFQNDPLDPGEDECQGQSQGHYESTDFHPPQQTPMLLMTTPTTSSGIGAMKSDSQDTRNEESLIDNDQHDHVPVPDPDPESIAQSPATPSPTKNPLEEDSEDDDDDEDEDDDDDDDYDDAGNQSHNATVGSTNTSTSTTTHSTSGSNATAEMPSEKYMKRIGYNRRLHICPYCKTPVKINNRFRHLLKHCQLTPAQLRFEESKKGSVEHWPKATLAEYENFYKGKKISVVEIDNPSSSVTTTARAEIEKKRVSGGSAVKMNQGQGSVRPENEKKNTGGELTAVDVPPPPSVVEVPAPRGTGGPKRSVKTEMKNARRELTDVPESKTRGRSKGTLKIYMCSYCGKKMYRLAIKEHEKKCRNKESDSVDIDDEEDKMKPATTVKRSRSTSRNSVAASASPADKIGQCDICLRSMLVRSIPRHKREACKGKDDDDSSVSTSKVKDQDRPQRPRRTEEDFENEDDDAAAMESTSANRPFDPASRACSYEDCKFVPETHQDYESHLLVHPLDITICKE